MAVYFPRNYIQSKAGVLLGFHDSTNSCVVAAIVEATKEGALTFPSDAGGCDGYRLEVVGRWALSDARPSGPGHELVMRPSHTHGLPVVASHPSDRPPCALVLYDRPVTRPLAAALRLARAIQSHESAAAVTPSPTSTFSLAVQRMAAAFERALRTPLPGNRPPMTAISLWANHVADKLAAVQDLLPWQRTARNIAAAVAMVADTMMGAAAGIVLYIHAEQWSEAGVQFVNAQWVTEVGAGLQWVMGTPGGIKLNGALAAFLASVFLQYVAWWASAIAMATPLIPAAMRCLALCAIAGLSSLVCAGWDVFRIATLHISLMSQFAGRLHRWAVCYLASTWRFFIGKKWNVLRKRVDSSELGIDHLLLNAVFFTTLLFLYPTVLAYYLFFATYGLCLVGGTLLVQLGATVMARLPLARLYQCLFAPASIGDEALFQLLKPPADCRPGDYYVAANARPVRISRLLEEVTTVGQAVASEMTWEGVTEALLFAAQLPIIRMPPLARLTVK